ncbi:Rid family hydrolase [Mesorhizobium sp. VK4C]|uniref:Rid family hydrolase n=1 Tax=Mesorhizobium captivum TaxID=3072319 RepID=UPI002A24B7D1|nr:Rid family hydrolase [Mesorhizobium sp. VK4C]MDX8500685.1 Rid family hydrolase [Mesorhizobium sp. VK4C]
MTGVIKRFVNGDPSLKTFQAHAPWAEAVEVPPGATFLFLSGQVPPPLHEDSDPDNPASYGSTEDQTRAVLTLVGRLLADKGYAMGDIVKMSAYLCADPARGSVLDLDGFGAAYREFFSETGPLPARTRVEVRQLMSAAWLVEIEVIAAKVR